MHYVASGQLHTKIIARMKDLVPSLYHTHTGTVDSVHDKKTIYTATSHFTRAAGSRQQVNIDILAT